MSACFREAENTLDTPTNTMRQLTCSSAKTNKPLEFRGQQHRTWKCSVSLFAVNRTHSQLQHARTRTANFLAWHTHARSAPPHRQTRNCSANHCFAARSQPCGALVRTAQHLLSPHLHPPRGHILHSLACQAPLALCIHPQQAAATQP
jgi:hypothetical protein